MLPTIEDLEKELRGLIVTLPAFSKGGFSAFDLLDADSKRQGFALPAAGTVYVGAEPIGSDGMPVSAVNGASLLAVQFMVVIAIQYSYTGQEDTKPSAFSLLDQIRSLVLGYKGVNTRPWRFIGERPEPAASGDGVAFYSQVWQTILPSVGTFNNQ